jgi:CRISPR-associated endonuclease/helicase Cas3
VDFFSFFGRATEGAHPYPYQERFAAADPLPHLLRVPTGAGKTATATLGWLWRQKTKPSGTPRRLVYCLPMRVLVEQSYSVTQNWLKNLGLQEQIGLHLLMGGVDHDAWYLYPENAAILIGTQDMLLSRTLNRGYAASRFHWPIDFGLLNNDCLWVFDEPQLMGSGVTTSAQLAGLRKTLGGVGECPSVWMSATLEPSWLDTVDFAGKFTGDPLELDEEDYDPKRELYKRMTAAKTLQPLAAASSTDMKDVAKKVWENHQPGTQTLVVLNTVDRAKAVYGELLKLWKKAETPKLLLVHSRFRPHDRQKLNEKLQQKNAADRIIVATQVVEAGVDISARTLITELAPWASIVQRIGRCNRTGDDGTGQVFWIDLDEKLALPYTTKNLDFAREQLNKLDGKDVSPKALDEFKTREEITLPFEHKHVLRRRDLIDLFDTSPDLSGNDIDIARFVRGDDPDSDVQVFWRDMIAKDWDAAPARHELCNVPVGSIKVFLKKEMIEGFRWDHIDDDWRPIRDPEHEVRPGLTILLPTTVGGYDWNEDLKTGKGWDPDSKALVTPHPSPKKVKEEGTASDPNSSIPVALTIPVHTQNVCDELSALLKTIDYLPDGWPSHLARSARWHDAGKAHFAFQEGMRKANAALTADHLWAKSGTNGKLTYARTYFRHELASALVALQHGLAFEAAYLIASHHGKVRLSIRSLPGEEPPDDGKMFALGVHDGDELPDVELCGETCPATTLDLSPMHLGGDASWTGRALKLLAEFGPFKLAYLEAILRTADVRASRKEANDA